MHVQKTYFYFTAHLHMDGQKARKTGTERKLLKLVKLVMGLMNAVFTCCFMSSVMPCVSRNNPDTFLNTL